ncbi:MAG: BlaI/MecI/CopY family transcriptional regulator [Actinomycetota bacterium]|nr:BlaI/MecI/CopY family transcriptional regulator [Actinomycetota bacterium]MDD5601151.1 BlaI/MecI/CopY family transcriptional regulator [Actinomycetota bacterium]
MTKNSEVKKKSEEIGINGLNSISNLEADIMNIIWSKGRVTVREVHEDMLRKEIESKEHGFIPYTTVMSTMTTLAEKGLLKQDKTSKTYLYSAAVDRKELSKRIIKSVAEKLLDEDTAKKVSKFLSEAL